MYFKYFNIIIINFCNIYVLIYWNSEISPESTNLFKFPSNPTLRKSWMTKLCIQHQPNIFDKVCASHFKNSDFYNSNGGKNMINLHKSIQ